MHTDSPLWYFLKYQTIGIRHMFNSNNKFNMNSIFNDTSLPLTDILFLYIVISMFCMAKLYNLGVDGITIDPTFKRWSERNTLKEKVAFIGTGIGFLVLSMLLGFFWPLFLLMLIWNVLFKTRDDYDDNDDEDENGSSGGLAAS